MTYNIFYKGTAITWITTNTVTSDIIAAQAAQGVSHFTKESDTEIILDSYYVNGAGDDIVLWLTFSPTEVAKVDMGSTASWPGIPQDTSVYINDSSVGTVPADGTVTFTGTKPGVYTVKLTKTGYRDYTSKITVELV